MQQNYEHASEAENLYRQVVTYDREGDVYNAVKLCKHLARLTPDWSAPFAYLGAIYKARQEWRPTLHYCLKAVENNPFDEKTWENLALAATALEEWETARNAWNQLGFKFKKSDETLALDLGIVPVRLNPAHQPEVVEARRIDPARAIIESIPQPSSGRRYQDLILIDRQASGTLLLNGKKLGVYDELQVLKTSPWRTFATTLHTSSLNDVQTLAQLCADAGLGFDNWSHAARFFRLDLHPKVSEYFNQPIFGQPERDSFLVAMAARQAEQVGRVLKSWEIISLQKFSGLESM
jgi:tetratricopeptide (TPR) repeat protein